MLNSIIKIDLHIHSIASEYKEPTYADGSSIVKNSSADNADLLLKKLVENQIKMFSITDHNRFNSELYKVLSKKLKNEIYEDMGLLFGIEFDVCLEYKKNPVHIIAIFDVKNECDVDKIDQTINQNELKTKADAYTKEQFEKILKDIGLNTILIVHQRCSLDKQQGNHNSLSEGVSDPYKIVQVGYIAALEYQKPNVEGIIKNNLSNLETNIALITGSDCHDWEVYPKHDKNQKDEPKYFSKIKALPTFKGLLLALSSVKTRFNRDNRIDTNYIHSFNIGDNKINLDPGINAIIGENGSGKTTLFRILSDNFISERYIKNLQKENKITVSNLSEVKVEAINQSELTTKFQDDGRLFDDDNLFEAIDTDMFESTYSEFARKLKKYIEDNIKKQESLKALSNRYFEIDMNYEDSATLYVLVSSTEFNTSTNPHLERRKKLSNIITGLLDEYNNSYYIDNLKKKISCAIKYIREVYDEVEKKENALEYDGKVKNIITRECKEYNKTVKKVSTSEDNEISNYRLKKEKFITDIVETIKINSTSSNGIAKPSVCEGQSKKRKGGYVFSKECNYNKIDVFEKFLEFMFNKRYREKLEIIRIDSRQKFVDAITNCSKFENIEECWQANFLKFLNWAKTEKEYIKEETSDDSIGNTLGEMSLVYYKFKTEDDNECDVLMIDQPEDNISNNRIAEKLINYFDSIRQNKQLIIVTHNPLLVVNLDVDNVIHLNKVNDKICVTAGCLEDEENRILYLVSTTMDGGKEMIEKRLKIYG